MLKMAVLDRQEGVEKSTPNDPMPMGAIRKEIILSEDPSSRYGLTAANPMPRKKKALTDQSGEGQWGLGW